MAQLPRHLYKGRANVGGPVSGYYLHVHLGPIDVGINATDGIPLAFRAPFDLRLMEIRLTSTIAGADTASCIFRKHTALTTGGTALSGTITLGVANNDITAGYSGGEDEALVETSAIERNITKDQYVFPVFTTNGTGTVVAGNFNMVFFVIGHVSNVEGVA